MIPRITISLIVFMFIAYIVGARYPGIAAKIGLA